MSNSFDIGKALSEVTKYLPVLMSLNLLIQSLRFFESQYDLISLVPPEQQRRSIGIQTAFHLVSQQSKLAGEPSKCHFNSNPELGEVINKSCTNLTIADKNWRKTKQNPKNDNCWKKLAKVVRKRQKCFGNDKS
jgi:hypothetical protein